jgi:mannose-6-phosphate isomerase-like protein (cupin superfamily)
VLSVGERYESPDGKTWIEILAAPDSGQGDIVVRRMQKPGKGRLLPHVHLDYTERFKVEQGRATARLGSHKVEAGPGEEVLIAPGENHMNPYNASDEELVMVHSFEPAPEFIQAFVETFCHLTRQGRTDRQGEVPLSAVFAVADATGTESFAVGMPHGFQRSVMAPIGARVARMRGYELRLP